MTWIPSPIRGVLSVLLYIANTLIWVPPICACAAIKICLPFAACRRLANRVLIAIAAYWVSGNNTIQRLMTRTRLLVEGLDQSGLKKNGWYLVLSNHQSWVDILVLQRIFNRRIPMLKFFIKKELIWMPVLGQIWWIFDFPFMKRYSSAFLEKNPHLRGQDLEITRKACQKFKDIPVSVMNFVEGTRFTLEKHLRQASPYTHLLKPRAGGTAMVLTTMGEHLSHIIDVTIAYPDGMRSFWAFLCGKVREVRVKVETLPVTREILGDYFSDPDYRERFQQWLNTRWQIKDRTIASLCLPCSQPPCEYLPEG